MEEHFAALRIPDSDNDVKLTRALSFSELPTTRRVYLEQRYQSGVSTDLIRQYSCEQIFDKGSLTRQVKISKLVKAGGSEQQETWETTIPAIDGFKVPEWPPRKSKLSILPPKFVPKDVEYMDVDDTPPFNRSLSLSPSSKLAGLQQKPRVSNSEPSKGIEPLEKDRVESKPSGSAIQEDKANYQGLKKKLRPLVSMQATQKIEEKSGFPCMKMVFFILLPIAGLLAGIVVSPEYFGLFTPCDGNSIFCNAREDLRQQVFGQPKAVLALSSLLINDKSQMKVLCFVGGTGVGKSYTAEIIKKNFPLKHNSFLYFPPLSEKLDITTLSSVACNLIIIENLKQNDIANVAMFLSPLKDLKKYCVVAIAIFNVEYMNNNLETEINLPESMDKIQRSFKEYELQPAMVEFVPLSEEALEQCISEAAQASQLLLSNHQMNRMKDYLISANVGCKGAYSKVQIIGRG